VCFAHKVILHQESSHDVNYSENAPGRILGLGSLFANLFATPRRFAMSAKYNKGYMRAYNIALLS